MSDCADRFESLNHEVNVVLDEDLAALQRMPEQTRIERYNQIKANEEEFVWEFSEECPDFLTDAERDRARGDFRLARLLIAASLFEPDTGALPRPLASEFVDAELQAVVDFDRYKQFDALSESQIERKIRRMDGEVYELVREYTSTQIANVDELVENPDVQQDLIERLLDRYEDRREKIRRGFFVYVETHGLEHMVEAIEDAVRAVNESVSERGQIREELRGGIEELSETLEGRLETQRRHLETEIHSLEKEFARQMPDTDGIQSELESLQQRTEEMSRTQETVLRELEAQIEQTTDLERRIETKVEELHETKQRAIEDASQSAQHEARELVESELEKLHEQRDELDSEMRQLKRERDRIRAARDSLDETQQTLESRVDEIRQSVGTEDSKGIEGGDVVTSTMAKLLELDYLGRFDISMHETTSIQTPDGTFGVPSGYWDDRSSRRSHRSRLVDLIEDGDPERYPANESARYEITATEYLFNTRTEMVIEARVLGNLEAYAANGFDAQPNDLDDLLRAVNVVVAEAESREYAYLIGIASPTGWTDRVRSQIRDKRSARTRFSQYVSVVLIDLQEGVVIYDESDPVARENADLFDPAIDAERIEECVQTIRTEYVSDLGHDSILLSDLVDEHEYDEHVVKRAFNRLESEGAGEQLYIDEFGLSLDMQ